VLSSNSQLYWAKIALEKYSTEEHNNLSNLEKINATESKECNEKNLNSEDILPPKHIWFDSIKLNDNFQSFNKLRWSCLGYHYDWTTRSYEKNLHSVFPSELSALCSNIAKHVGLSLQPEAAIVNYYPLGTCMSGHVDDAELTMDEPIVSISLGRSAIFLIGSRSKTDTPIQILVSSGDANEMSGESRYCYHGVPYIYPINSEEIVREDNEDIEYNNLEENDTEREHSIKKRAPKGKVALLVLLPQVDFFSENSDLGDSKFCEFLKKNTNSVDSIYITLDSHHVRKLHILLS
jgi:DNA alkylation damage repair protein AlkB